MLVWTESFSDNCSAKVSEEVRGTRKGSFVLGDKKLVQKAGGSGVVQQVAKNACETSEDGTERRRGVATISRGSASQCTSLGKRRRNALRNHNSPSAEGSFLQTFLTLLLFLMFFDFFSIFLKIFFFPLQDSKFHPYKMQLVQELRPIDFETRVAFATAQLDIAALNPGFFECLLFSDEAHFPLHGEVNTQNFRYWSDRNPGWFRQEPLHSPRLTVWAAIGKLGVVGPVIFQETVNAVRYRALLADRFLQVVRNWPRWAFFTGASHVVFLGLSPSLSGFKASCSCKMEPRLIIHQRFMIG